MITACEPPLQSLCPHLQPRTPWETGNADRLEALLSCPLLQSKAEANLRITVHDGHQP